MSLARVAVVLLLAAAASGCTRGPAVVWTPQPLEVSMEPNAFRSYTASLRALAPISSLDLEPSAGLRPLLSVIPTSVANVAANERREVGLDIFVPATVRPGERITGTLSGLDIVIWILPPTAEGALESLRASLAAGHDEAYLAQFTPARAAEERQTVATLTDTARIALELTVRSAERIAL